MRGHESDHDGTSPNGTDSDLTAPAVPTDLPGQASDADALLLDLFARWEERYRRGDDATPESLGADPALGEALRALIGDQKRLYARLGLGMPPAAAPEGTDRGLPSIPGHEVLGEIGRGGMGVVYKARDLKLGRIVAIKTIAEGRHATLEQRERFRAEAQAVARLRHPNIIAIYAIDEHEDRPHLSLEYAEGGSLARRLAERLMAARDAAALAETLAHAIHAAHQAGVVHRDLKPSNILLTAENVPKVSDFGLAKLLDAGSERTASNQVMGSPSYMSPEQAEGHSRQVGPTADVYSLGAILYQALTGRPPFLGESALETLKLVSTTEVVAPRLLRPDVPRDLETICLKCLEKEPGRRYDSAQALADDLGRYLDNRPIAARPVGAAGRLVRWSRRNPWVAGLSAAVLGSLLLGITTSTWLAVRAIHAEAATRQQRNKAELEASRFKAVGEFLRKDMLAQASVGNQDTRGFTPDPNLQVRTALDRAAARIGERFKGEPLVEASIRQTIGETYYQLGLFSQARPHLERSIALRRGTLGDDHPETYSALHSMGILLHDDGRWTEAERFLVPALDGFRKIRSADDLETLEAMADVASLYFQLDRAAEAEALLTRAAAGFRRTRGSRDIRTLQANDDLAMAYLAQKNVAEAKRLEEEVVREMNAEFGAESPCTLIATRNLASAYAAGGETDRAEQLWRDVLRDMRRLLGDKHPETLHTLFVIAWHDMYHGKVDEAETLSGELLDGARAVLNDKHQLRAAALGFLANIYAGKRDLKRLEPVLVEAVELARFRWGDDADVTARGCTTLVLLLVHLEQYARAEPYCRIDLAFRERHSASPGDRFWAELHLGISLLGQKKRDEAGPLLLSAYNRMKPEGTGAALASTTDLRRIVEAILRLCDGAGRPLHDAALAKLRSDPFLQGVILDPYFPDDAFAPPSDR